MTMILQQVAKVVTVGIASYTVGIDLMSIRKCMKMNKIHRLLNDNVSYTRSEYIASVDSSSKVVENLDAREEWNKLCTIDINTSVVLEPGTYTYVYRNYLDFEEQYSIASKRSLLHRIVFTRLHLTKMNISDNNVHLLENFRILGIKVSVEWFGNICSNNTIIWNTSRVVCANKFVLHTPKVSESKRIFPWRLLKAKHFYVYEILDDSNTSKRMVFIKT